MDLCSEDNQWDEVAASKKAVWVLRGAPGCGKSFSIKLLLQRLFATNVSCNVAVLVVKPGNMQDLYNDLADVRNKWGVDVFMVGQLAERGARSFYHFLVVDECQDILPGLGSRYLEVEMLCKCLHADGSVFLLGDDRQILNVDCVGVGDVARAFSNNMPGSKVSYLSDVNVTRRCPQQIVSLANVVSSGSSVAPLFEIGLLDFHAMYGKVGPGDLIVTPSAFQAAKIACQFMVDNARSPCKVRLAYNYAMIDLLRMFLSHIQTLVADGAIGSHEMLQQFFLLKHAESASLYDKLFAGRAHSWGVWMTFMELVTGLCHDYDFKDQSKFSQRISLLTKCLVRDADSREVVTVGTVEDTKGSSANRVFFVDPHELGASALAIQIDKDRWQKHVQNHLFVAITRSRRDFFLVFPCKIKEDLDAAMANPEAVLRCLAATSPRSFQALCDQGKRVWKILYCKSSPAIFGTDCEEEEVMEVSSIPDEAFARSTSNAYVSSVPQLGIGPTGVEGSSANAVANMKGASFAFHGVRKSHSFKFSSHGLLPMFSRRRSISMVNSPKQQHQSLCWESWQRFFEDAGFSVQDVERFAPLFEETQSVLEISKIFSFDKTEYLQSFGLSTSHIVKCIKTAKIDIQ